MRHTPSRRGSRWFGHRPQKVERAPNARSAVKYVQVDHGGVEIPMTQQLLHGPNVVSSAKQLRRERMAHGVRGDALIDARTYTGQGVGMHRWA